MSGGANVRSGTPDSVGSAGSAGQQPRSQYQYAGQPGYQPSHSMPGQSTLYSFTLPFSMLMLMVVVVVLVVLGLTVGHGSGGGGSIRAHSWTW